MSWWGCSIPWTYMSWWIERFSLILTIMSLCCDCLVLPLAPTSADSREGPFYHCYSTARPYPVYNRVILGFSCGAVSTGIRYGRIPVVWIDTHFYQQIKIGFWQCRQANISFPEVQRNYILSQHVLDVCNSVGCLIVSSQMNKHLPYPDSQSIDRPKSIPFITSPWVFFASSQTDFYTVLKYLIMCIQLG